MTHETYLSAFCELASRHVAENYLKIRRYEFELQRMLNQSFFKEEFEKVLEIGCGIGYKSMLWSGFSAQVDGIDIKIPYHGFPGNLPAVDLGNEILREIGYEKVRLVKADFVEYLSDHKDAYDCIFSDYLFEHIENLPELITHIHGALKPGGKTVHIIPNTHEAMIQFNRLNLQPVFPSLIKALRGLIHGFIHGNKRHMSITGHGLLVPITHSEFISEYHEQFEIYRLENFLLPMVEAGFQLTSIVPVREHSYSVFATKPFDAQSPNIT